MNSRLRKLALALAVAMTAIGAAQAGAQEQKPGRGESFYIVASVDQAKSQLLLKLPTEVTSIMNVTGKTQYLDENGKAISLSALRAGDTVWVTTSGTPPSATRVRRGPMTVAELHRSFLDYPEIK